MDTDTTRIEIDHGTSLRLRDADGGDGIAVTFQRTLRIPDDGRDYPLPPGLGGFPLRRVRDYASRVPDGWAAHGGVFLPMYQREAMWLLLHGAPHALRVGIGKVCAITGERWRGGLARSPQNYVVVGTQPWLDGIASGRGTVRQFVAMPLGLGYTVEGQLTGEESTGGIQLQSYAPRPGRAVAANGLERGWSATRSRGGDGGMGLAAGGRMRQNIYRDPWGVDAWQPAQPTRVFVHIVNSELWRDITGEAAPATPVTAKSYASAGLPWFELYDEGRPALGPAAKLAGVQSIRQLDATKRALQDDDPVAVGPIHPAHPPIAVDDGDW